MARESAPAPDCNVEVDCRGEGGAYCGKCCRRAVVPLLRSDIERLAERLGDTSRYVEWVSGVPVLKRSESGACIFLDASGRCVVYERAPRRYPALCAGLSGSALLSCFLFRSMTPSGVGVKLSTLTRSGTLPPPLFKMFIAALRSLCITCP